MQNGFDGIVSGLYTIPNCVMTECDINAAYEQNEDVMYSLVGGKAFRLVSESNYDENNNRPACRCHVARLFGIGMVGGGVFCRIMRMLGEAGIGFYGASISECGIAIALPRERFEEAVRLLSRNLLEQDCT